MKGYKYFENVTSLEDFLQRFATLEVLLSSIVVDKDNVNILPIRCPAKGRSNDFLKNNEGNAACRYGKEVCKYFARAEFKLDGYVKNIQCNFKG